MDKKNVLHQVIHFPLTKIIAGITVVGGVAALGQMGAAAALKAFPIEGNMRILLSGAISAILAIVSYNLLFRFYEKREVIETSTKGMDLFLIPGIALGAALQGLTILVIYQKGGFAVLSVNPVLFIIPSLVMAFTTAILEEVLVRGVVFRVLQEKLGSYIALMLSALLFGLLHIANPNSSLTAALGLALQAGVLLGVAYMYSRNLWFPIAIHFAWNFTQSGIFGAAVSGNATRKSLLTTKIEGEEWYTGGAFGPEGSVQATVFCVVAALGLLYLCHKDKKIVKPYWKKK
jgi:membrane protease YdiL (CAAX protease family)